MAGLVFREFLHREGLDDRVKVTSAGTGGWHVGEKADYRAARTLADNGYPHRHTAAILSRGDLDADLLVALDGGHERALRRLVAQTGGDPSRIKLLRSFDPHARGNLDVPDPYYGANGGFTEVLRMIEASMPGLLDWVRAHLSE
jgi:low molecular weight protein-tyrosine phosphatase